MYLCPDEFGATSTEIYRSLRANRSWKKELVLIDITLVMALLISTGGIMIWGLIWRRNREYREWNGGLCKATGTPWERCAMLDRYDCHAYIASQVRPWKIHHKPKQQTTPFFGQCTNQDPDGLNYYLWIDPVVAMLRRPYRHVLESTVMITPAYIRDSLRKSPTQCALAKALHNDVCIRSVEHYTPYYKFVVTHDSICLLEQLYPQEPQSKFLLEVIKINPNLRLWLSDYDEHREVSPIQVKITLIPSDFDYVRYTAEAEIIPSDAGL